MSRIFGKKIISPTITELIAGINTIEAATSFKTLTL
jgi:hypothetical protein